MALPQKHWRAYVRIGQEQSDFRQVCPRGIVEEAMDSMESCPYYEVDDAAIYFVVLIWKPFAVKYGTDTPGFLYVLPLFSELTL